MEQQTFFEKIDSIKLPKNVEFISKQETIGNEPNLVYKYGDFYINIYIGKHPYSSSHYLYYEIRDIDANPILKKGYYGSITHDNLERILDRCAKMLSLDKGSHPTPSKIVSDIGFGIYSNGISGTIRQYFLKPCVVAYVKDYSSCVMIIKLKRKGYEGLKFLGVPNGFNADNWINISCRRIGVSQALKRMEIMRNTQPEIMDLNDEDKSNIISLSI